VQRGTEAAERLGDEAGPARPLLRVLLEALEDDLLQGLGDVDPHGSKRGRDLVRDPVQNRLDLARERRLAGEALVEDRSESVESERPSKVRAVICSGLK
jgi:hypothetical protein